MGKMKTSNISGNSFSIFFHNVSWKNNRLFNINYWDDLDIIDQGHSHGNVLQFSVYFG